MKRLFLLPKIRDFLENIFVGAVFAAASIAPLLYTVGSLGIAYDTFLPFDPANSFRLTYQWLDRQNGQYVMNVYSVWTGTLWILQKIGGSIYNAGFLLQFFIYFLSAIGIYKLFRLFGKKKVFGVLAGLSFIFSPFQLDFIQYELLIIAIVWLTYFLFKFLKNKRMSFTDPIIMSLLLSLITDLPNPKYHFLLFILFGIALITSLGLKIITWASIKKNLPHIFFFLMLSAYIVIPFLYYGYSINKNSSLTINTRKNYGETGPALDYGVATIDKMVQLFHAPNLTDKSIKILSEPWVIIAYYLLPIFVLFIAPYFIYKKKGDYWNYFAVMHLMALLFIFLSKGTNPPFGFIYDSILSLKIFSFMRTTAGVIIFAAVFYAVLFGYVSERLYEVKKYFLALSMFVLIGSSIPFINGNYYETKLSNYKAEKSYGIQIPDDYLFARNVMNTYPSDQKIEVVPGTDGYANTVWGYYGFVFYPWLFKQPVVSIDRSNVNNLLMLKVNTGFILHDKTLIPQLDVNTKLYSQYEKIYSSDYVDIYKVPDGQQNSIFTVARHTILSDIVPPSYAKDTYKKESLFYYSPAIPATTQLLLPRAVDGQALSSIQYKEFSPTKYKVKLIGVRSVIPLIFFETFNDNWRLSLDSIEPAENPSYVESFDQHAVINNSLAPRSSISTLFSSAVNDHLTVNKLFNSWIISPSELCSKMKNCRYRNGEAYDIELTAEFFPQILVNISYLISAVGLISYALWYKLKSRNEKQ
jgi:hypothetical protein